MTELLAAFQHRQVKMLTVGSFMLISALGFQSTLQAQTAGLDFDQVLRRASREGRYIMVMEELPECRHCEKRSQMLTSVSSLSESVLGVSIIVDEGFDSPMKTTDVLRMRPVIYGSLLGDHYSLGVAFLDANARYLGRTSASESAVTGFLERLKKKSPSESQNPLWGYEELITNRAEEVINAAKKGCAPLENALMSQEDPCVLILAIQSLRKWSTDDGTSLWTRLLLHDNFFVQKAALERLLAFRKEGIETARMILGPHLYSHMMQCHLYGPNSEDRLKAIHPEVALKLCDSLLTVPSLESADVVSRVFCATPSHEIWKALPKFCATLARQHPENAGKYLARCLDFSGFHYRAYQEGLEGIHKLEEQGRLDQIRQQYGEERDFLVTHFSNPGQLGNSDVIARVRDLKKVLDRLGCTVSSPDWSSATEITSMLLQLRTWSEEAWH